MPRPTKYSKALADKILDRMADGESLSAICREDSMPSRKTVRRWADGERGAPASFGLSYARARNFLADVYFDDVVEIADSLPHGVSREELSRAQLRIDARKWTCGRMNPAKYGDRTQIDVGGQEGAAPVPLKIDGLTKPQRSALKKLLRGRGK